MGGLAAALLADILGGLLLVLGGPAAIWRTLWVFWAESAAAGIVAAIGLRRGMASLSDEAWLAYAAQSLDAMDRRGPQGDETPHQHALRVQQRRERLAALAALDRRAPEGATAFAHARSTEGALASGIFGCAFVLFSIVHAGFLLILWLFQAAFSMGSSLILGGGPGSGGLGAGGLGGPGGGGLNGGGLGDAGPVALVVAPEPLSLLPFLVVMGLVFIVGLAPLRRPGQMGESEAAMKKALTRTFILQIVIIVGAVPSIFLGSAPLAFVFVGVKTVADVATLWRRRAAVRR